MKGRNNMNHKYKLLSSKISLFLAGIFVLLATGCDVHFYDTNQKLNEGEHIWLQHADGSVVQAVYQEDRYYKATTDNEFPITGAYVTDGKVSWVPEYVDDFRFSTAQEVRASNDWGNPKIAPFQAAIKDIYTGKSSYSEHTMNFIVLDIFGVEGQKVDGRTHIYATTESSDILFVDFDNLKGYQDKSYGDSSSTIFGNYILNDAVISEVHNLNSLSLRSLDQVEEGVVGFLVANTMNLPYFELELYSGEKQDSNLIGEKVDVFLTPLWPHDETVTGTNITQTGVMLSWPSIETIAGITPQGYHIYQDGALIQTVAPDVMDYDVTALSSGTTYRFEVKAIYNDKVGKEGLSVQVTTANSIPDSSGSSDDDNPPPVNNKVTASNGKISITVGRAGEVSLEDKIVITIPANATNQELSISVEKVLETQSLLRDNEILASSVFEILKNFTENFSNPVTLTFSFDPNRIESNQQPVVFYYDEEKKSWIEVGGKVSGNTITVEVDHFTKFAVFAVSDAEPSVTPAAETNSTIALSDISAHWAETAIKQALGNKIVAGYADGTFKPNKSVTRAEFAVMLTNALMLQEKAAALIFTDTMQIGAWARQAVAQAVQAGIISGYTDGAFHPNAEITRAEMAVMLANALGASNGSIAATDFADDSEIPVWAKGSAAYVKQAGIVQGKGSNNFAPQAHVTRAEAVTALLQMLLQQGK
jgi:hypothetical protein